MADPAPVPHASRRRVPWILGALVLALVGLIAVGVVRARRDTLARAHGGGAGGGPPPAAEVGAGGDIDEIADLLRRARGNPGVLIEAYAAWASDPRAQGRRRLVLGALAAEPQPMARLGALLAAAQASPLPLDADPLVARWSRRSRRYGPVPWCAVAVIYSSPRRGRARARW